jgi:hypothetical protein
VRAKGAVPVPINCREARNAWRTAHERGTKYGRSMCHYYVHLNLVAQVLLMDPKGERVCCWGKTRAQATECGHAERLCKVQIISVAGVA